MILRIVANPRCGRFQERQARGITGVPVIEYYNIIPFSIPLDNLPIRVLIAYLYVASPTALNTPCACMLSRLVLLLLRRRNAVVVGRSARLSRDRISCCETSDGGSDGNSPPRYRSYQLLADRDQS